MHSPSQPFIEGVERVTTLKVSKFLGVLLNARFTMTDTGFEHLLFFNVGVETSPDPRSPTATTPPGGYRATTVASILYATRRGGVSRGKGTVYAWNGS